LSERLIRASAAGSETSWKILDQIPLIQSFFISKANKQTQTYDNPTNAKLQSRNHPHNSPTCKASHAL
jgi:hypothetical protein